ncbi:ABC transporter permease [Stappia sp. 28M-7]|nr:ABC transporter permease [Stappia sp. 28M-7]
MNMPLLAILVLNNFREYLRDFTSSFFTFVFPLIFVVIFFMSSSGGGAPGALPLSLQGDLAAPQAQAVVEALSAVPGVRLLPAGHEAAGTVTLTVGAGGRVALSAAADPSLARVLETAMLAAAGRQAGSLPFDYSFEPVRRTSELVQLLPAFFAMSLLQLGLFGTSTPLLQQRARGVFRHMKTLPITVVQIVSALLVTRLAIALVQMVGLYAIATGFFGFRIEGSGLLFAALLALGTGCFVAMGFALGGIIGNQQVGVLATLAINFLMLSFGNVFFQVPRDSALAVVSDLLPITYLVDGLRQAATGEPQALPLALVLAVLAAATVLLTAVSVRFFRFDMGQQA